MTLNPQPHPDALSDMVHAYVERIKELEAEVAHVKALLSDARGGLEFWRHETNRMKARVAELQSHNHWTKCELCAREKEEE